MLLVLIFLSYVGAILALAFLALAIASALYYVSEFIEERSEFAKRTLQQLIYIVIVIHFGVVIFDKFPVFTTAFSIVAHLVYSINLRKFPFISLTSPYFIVSCALVLINHYLFFRHFSNYPSPGTIKRYRLRTGTRQLVDYEVDVPTFGQAIAFFGICVWLVPFGLFLSLSVSDSTLPTIASDGQMLPGVSAQGNGRRAQALVKKMVVSVAHWVNRNMQAFRWSGSAEGRNTGDHDRFQ